MLKHRADDADKFFTGQRIKLSQCHFSKRKFSSCFFQVLSMYSDNLGRQQSQFSKPCCEALPLSFIRFDCIALLPSLCYGFDMSETLSIRLDEKLADALRKE